MEQIIERFKRLDTTCVSDAMDRLGIECCALGIKPIRFGQKICGRAFTVQYVPCEEQAGTVGDFLDDVQPGQVVVIANGGRNDCTVWGDIMSKNACDKKIAGTVIDGVCRDVTAILEYGYPVFSKGYYMRTGKDRVCASAINAPVSISDVTVFPGDIILGDDNGVVVISSTIAEQVAEIAESIDETESRIVALITAGHPLREARRMTGYHHLQTRQERPGT